MKKALIIIGVVIAAISLTAYAANASSESDGTVYFECAAMPALNCSLSIVEFSRIYSMAPDNIRDICEEQYVIVSDKCAKNPRFTYQGVNVRVLKNDGKVATIEFSVPGYKITTQDVSWKDLDIIFVGLDQ